jgi:hypothetical protein
MLSEISKDHSNTSSNCDGEICNVDSMERIALRKATDNHIPEKYSQKKNKKK